MREFRLLAHGKDFDVDLFLANCKLRPSLVWHRGVPSKGHLDTPETSGFDVLLADSRGLNRREQEAIAIRYLEENFEDLLTLGNREDLDHFMVFIHDRRDICPDTCGFFTEHSRRLLTLTLRLNMDAVTHVELNRVCKENHSEVTLQLLPSEAVILDAMMRRYSETGTLTIQNTAEQQCLWNVNCLLEKNDDRPVWPSIEDAIKELSPDDPD